MSPLDRRQFLIGAAGTAGLLALAACSSDDGDGDGGASSTAPQGGAPGAEGLAAPGSTGLIDEDLWQQRIDGYLAHATTEQHLGNVTGIAVQLLAATRDDAYEWDVDGVSVDSLAETFEKIDAWEDTRDFELLYMNWLFHLGQGDTPTTRLSDEVFAAIEQRYLADRYRYDDPLPEGRTDDLWFWSENHRLIVLTNEFLAGQRFPDATFEVTGLTGAEHRDRSKAPILEWIDERARFGFFEWHSNVYMIKNIAPLVTLVEMADDPEIVQAAALALDLAIADVATHLQKGSYTAPRGRTYKKDKMTARHEATFGMAKILFDDTDQEYQNVTDTAATFLAAASTYRVPQVLLDVATSEDPAVVRERHGIFLDGGAPLEDPVEAPFGFDFEDRANLPVWWSLGAIGTWQTVRVSVAEMEAHKLWDTGVLSQVAVLADLNDRDPERIRTWVQERHAVVNFGNLSEANTYIWRHPKVALASVLDHRFGEMRDQAHAWQAQIDSEALVFTNHPITDADQSTEWRDDGRPGYWTGEASMPRTAQHERTAVHIYQPAWDETIDELLWGVFGYQPYTHAYVPQDRFDEVVQEGHWTVGAKDGGYIALWSWREPTWRVYDPEVQATDGMTQPFDLVAEGGPDNVWICEVGTDDDHATLADFVAAVTASEPVVDRDDSGFTVAWESPSSGAVGFGSDAAFTVDGTELPLGDHPRHESPWGQVDHLAKRFGLESDSSSWEIDFEAMTRTVA